MRSKNTPTLNVEIYPYFVKNDPENSDYNLDPYKKIFCDNLSKSQTIDRRVQTETKQ